MHKKITLALCFVFLFAFYTKAQHATFQFTTYNSTAAIDTALAFTGRIWSQYLNSPVPIKVNVYYANLFGSTLGVTIPNGRRDFPSAPLDSVWYPTSLANMIAGTELNPGEADMDIYIDNTQPWYFGTDGNPSFGQYDFVSVVLHEIGHGLGFLALCNVRDTIGSFGDVTLADISPIVPSFPFPDLQGKHSVFSTFLVNGSGQDLGDTLLFPNPSVLLADEFTSNSVYFNGPLAFVQNSSANVRLYAPAGWEAGSSLQHLNESTFPSGNPNTLMTPFISAGQVTHSPGWLTIAMLEDIGWNANHDVGVLSESSAFQLELFPNPVADIAFFRSAVSFQNERLEVIDISGKMVLAANISAEADTYFSVNCTGLSPGVYIVRLASATLRMIKTAR